MPRWPLRWRRFLPWSVSRSTRCTCTPRRHRRGRGRDDPAALHESAWDPRHPGGQRPAYTTPTGSQTPGKRWRDGSIMAREMGGAGRCRYAVSSAPVRRGLVNWACRRVCTMPVWVMRRMRMRLVSTVARWGRRGGRCRARAGGGSSGLRGGCCHRSGGGRSARASCGARMRVRGTPATSGGNSWPGEAALGRFQVIAGGWSHASQRGTASTSSSGAFDPCDGLTKRDGPRHHDGHGNSGRQGGP